MIFIGLYGDGVNRAQGSSGSCLQRLTSEIDALLPPTVGVHLLPFAPSSGDWGFAPNDWLAVRQDLGTWDDVADLAKRRPLLVDGIYNHVGVNHRWVDDFFAAPSGSSSIHAYREALGKAPESPRGESMLRSYSVGDTDWLLWQTFSDAAVDVRLDSEEVLEEIRRHVTLLSERGVWGVRLDAVAYYAKGWDGSVRHNAGVYRIAERITAMAENQGLHIVAQLDSDADGLGYFTGDRWRNVLRSDFTFTICLAAAILLEEPEILADHFERSKNIPVPLVRSPRTHDGLLLRSKLLQPSVRRRVTSLAQEAGLEVRFEGGDPYELNCSGPYLYREALGAENVTAATCLSAAITVMTADLAYFYLPYLLGAVPEDGFNVEGEEDPRAANRTPIDQLDFVRLASSDATKQVFGVMNALTPAISREISNAGARPVGSRLHASVFDDHGLKVSRSDVTLLANISRSSSVTIPRGAAEREPLFSLGASNSEIGPMGMVILDGGT